MTRDEALRVEIEQAAARGDNPETVAKVLAVPLAQVFKAWAQMDACAGLVDVWDVRPRVPVAVCGTRPGYERHRRAGEDACGACRDAKASASRADRARRKSALAVAS